MERRNENILEGYDLSNLLNQKSKDLDKKLNEEDKDAFIFQSSPFYLNGKLSPHQIEGLNWLVKMYESSINCILADEMGLGKTIQTIALLGYIKYVKKLSKIHLIILPKSTLDNWYREFCEFLPQFTVYRFYDSIKELQKTRRSFVKENWDICLTTYEVAISAKNILNKIDWSYVIVDETHRLKNEHCQLSQTVRVFGYEYRMLITGTPLQNNIHELWALLNFICPKTFDNSERFEKLLKSNDDVSKNSIEFMKKLISLFFLRREKKDVEIDLLPKKIINLYCGLTDMQRSLYKGILMKDLSKVIDKKDHKPQILNIIMQLRKCCNHPYLFPGVEPQPYTNDKHIIENSGKMIILDKLLVSLKKKNSRVLIFSQMALMLDIIEDYLTFKEYEFCRIDGSSTTEERIAAIDEYNQPGSNKFIFLLTTRAGGVGINLTTADSVIIYDSDWNPQMDLQAQDRAHRIGQKNQVCVFRLITANTIEEKIILRALKKLKLDDILLQKDKQIENRLSKEELMDILANGLDIGKIEEEQEIEDIISRGEKKTLEIDNELEKYRISENLSANKDFYRFEGQDYYIKKMKEFVLKNNDNSNTKILRTSALKPQTISKTIQCHDYQFYPEEFKELQEKEILLLSEGKTLSENEAERMKELKKQGFDISKIEYSRYLKAINKFGPNNIFEIKKALKNRKDAEAYHKTFLSRLDEIKDADRIKLKIKNGFERNIKRNKEIGVIKRFLNDPRDSDVILKKHYYNAKLLLHYYLKYIKESDLGVKIKSELLKSSIFSFNYLFLSKTPKELLKYCQQILNRLKKLYTRI